MLRFYYMLWSYRQVGKAVDCKSAIHQFESGWLLHISTRIYLFLDKILLFKMSGDVGAVERAGLENR